MDIINPVLLRNIHIIHPRSRGNVNINIFKPGSGGNINIFKPVSRGKIILRPVSGGNINIIPPVSGGKINIIHLVLPDPAGKDSIRFSTMKMESSIKHRSDISKEGLLFKPGKMDIINPVVAGKMNIISPVLRDPAGKIDIINIVFPYPAGKDNIRFRVMEEGSSIQHRSQNLQAEILSKKGLPSEPVNIDAANGCVVTPSRELQTNELTTVNLYKENAPSVVSIINIVLRQGEFTSEVLEVYQGYATGIIWDDKGHIVTNYHVIEGASILRVKLIDKSVYEAKEIGSEPAKDVAVLVIDAPKDKLRPVRIGISSNLLVGQDVSVIGNPYGHDHSLSTGIISGVGRVIDSPVPNCAIQDVIQTDAAINPGNSGGPLFDSSGFLIGVNTAMLAPSGTSVGIGYSIPVDTVSSIVREILRNPYMASGFHQINKWSN